MKKILSILLSAVLVFGTSVVAFANESENVLIEEGTKIIEFDIRPDSLVDSEYYYVYPNDVIYFDFSKRRFWAIDSYSGFLSVISSSLSMLVSVWNTFN